MSDDIVTRLLRIDRVVVPSILTEAAEEIERLRADRDEAEPLLEELWQRRTESTEMRAEIERLRAVVEAWLKYSQRAERDIETLRAERDEARRERDGYLDGNRQTLAALAEANEIAKKYKAERDEARRWICQLLANPTIAEGLASPCRGTPRDHAEEQGWDCFTEAR